MADPTPNKTYEIYKTKDLRVIYLEGITVGNAIPSIWVTYEGEDMRRSIRGIVGIEDPNKMEEYIAQAKAMADVLQEQEFDTKAVGGVVVNVDDDRPRLKAIKDKLSEYEVVPEPE